MSEGQGSNPVSVARMLTVSWEQNYFFYQILGKFEHFKLLVIHVKIMKKAQRDSKCPGTTPLQCIL